jgi:hypothetical protein
MMDSISFLALESGWFFTKSGTGGLRFGDGLFDNLPCSDVVQRVLVVSGARRGNMFFACHAIQPGRFCRWAAGRPALGQPGILSVHGFGWYL